jgi:hypothetical protein
MVTRKEPETLIVGEFNLKDKDVAAQVTAFSLEVDTLRAAQKLDAVLSTSKIVKNRLTIRVYGAKRPKGSSKPSTATKRTGPAKKSSWGSK